LQGETFRFVTLEVDGSLAHPEMALAFLLCLLGATTLSALYLFFAFRWAARGNPSSTPLFIATAFLILCGLLTQVAHQVLVTTIYQWDSPAVVSVGVWGGPPPILSWFAGNLLATGAFLVSRRLFPSRG
jgi:hypothetical protein